MAVERQKGTGFVQVSIASIFFFVRHRCRISGRRWHILEVEDRIDVGSPIGDGIFLKSRIGWL